MALVQEECKNDDLVEDIYLLAMECGEFTEDKASDAKLKAAAQKVLDGAKN